MESQESLNVDFVLLIQHLLLLAGEDQACQARQENWQPIHSLHSEGSIWVCTVSSGKTSILQPIHGSPVCSKSGNYVVAVAINY